MKKTVVFMIFLLFAGTLAYFGGYYLYVTNHPQTEFSEPVTVQKQVTLDNTVTKEEQEYYFAKLEQDMLTIYRMPEAVEYDSIKASSLHTSGMDESRLLEGMRFETIEEVFEFLESAMS